jgi:hypothetical protein
MLARVKRMISIQTCMDNGYAAVHFVHQNKDSEIFLSRMLQSRSKIREIVSKKEQTKIETRRNPR